MKSEHTSRPNRRPPPIQKFGALRNRFFLYPPTCNNLSHIKKTGSRPIARQPTPRGFILVVVKREG